jgi:hypothetical protein
VLGDAEHGSVWITDEEPSEAPVLVGDRMDDLRPFHERTFVDRVDVVDLDRNVRADMSLDVELQHAQLDFTLVRAEEQNPVESIAALQPDDLVIEELDFRRSARNGCSA